MRSLGLDPSEEEVSDILVRFDADGNGEIDKDEFVTMMNAILNSSMTTKRLLKPSKSSTSMEMAT